MEASPFARLSAELRNQIWTYAFYQPDGFYLDLQDDEYELPQKGHQIALIKTCRQINTETTLLLYNINKFLFLMPPVDKYNMVCQCMQDWLCAVGPAKANVITEVCVHLGHLAETAGYYREDIHKGPLISLFRKTSRLLDTSPVSCKNISKVTAAFTVELRSSEGKTCAFKLPLDDKLEAIRSVKRVIDCEQQNIMWRLFSGSYDHHSEHKGLIAVSYMMETQRWEKTLLRIVDESQ
ncbi:hypothetical protein KC340_g13332 [Hortaea werneckii]|nr:hypothetical protein KC342_g13657 [Hortaea werneckii]KAI7097052.1 hypothetical protein KC339_g9946 [Hortaea werneckii]KAI7220619.1 hypothetical protein KC365_g11947 [Hortaea werneckii]KAI7300548.1 hypothetical protein KC340_g13332 [Hortaea werneckii]KAI7376565.1 hypothetical protein KC328_g14842 [Hortaea werneckii]